MVLSRGESLNCEAPGVPEAVSEPDVVAVGRLDRSESPSHRSGSFRALLAQLAEDRLGSKEAMDIKLIRLLSEQLYNELQYSVTAPHLEVHPLFAHLNTMSPTTMSRLATKAIQRKHIARSDILFFAQEIATHMYFIQTGRLSYTKIRRNKEIVDAHEDWICEQVLWIKSWIHIGTATCINHSVLLLVDPHAFGDSIRQNPQVFSVVRDFGLKYIEWINSETLGSLSDITQGDQVSPRLKHWLDQIKAPRGLPFLKRMRSQAARRLSF